METQEARLKKIRAMRGQVDYSKLINGNLCKLKMVFNFELFDFIVGHKPEKMVLKIQLHMSLLAAEIEHVSNLFQEKQAELQSAVLRVDQVIRTLLIKLREILVWI